MADLPDLDPASIGFVAYWNAIDQGGVASIDAEEALTDGNILDHTLYDNGFEATYAFNLRTFTARVKNDGWFIVYFDRSNDFQTAVEAVGDHPTRGDRPFFGQYDVVGSFEWEASTNLAQNNLFRIIQNLQNELSSVSPNFAFADVGIWNYEFTPTAITVGGERDDAFASGTRNRLGDILYTSATTILYWATTAFAELRSSGYASYSNEFDGNVLMTGGDFSTGGWVARDALADFALPADTDMEVRIDKDHGGTSTDQSTRQTNVVMWDE